MKTIREILSLNNVPNGQIDKLELDLLRYLEEVVEKLTKGS